MSVATKSPNRARHRRTSRAAARLLAQHLDEVQRRLPPVIYDWQQQPKHLHYLRVSIRRAVTAIDVFDELLPKSARRLRKDLQDLRRASDGARDCDVLIERLGSTEHAAAESTILARLHADRVAAQEPLAAVDQVLRGEGQLAERSERLGWRLLRHVPTGHAGKRPFEDFARDAAQRQERRFWRAASADLTQQEDLHRLRIRGKQLRYTLDLLGSALPHKRVQRLYAKVIRLQDKLGAVNDHAVALEMLEQLSQSLADADAATLIDSLMQAERQALSHARESFNAWWTPKRRKALRRQLRRLHVG